MPPPPTANPTGGTSASGFVEQKFIALGSLSDYIDICKETEKTTLIDKLNLLLKDFGNWYEYYATKMQDKLVTGLEGETPLTAYEWFAGNSVDIRYDLTKKEIKPLTYIPQAND